MGSILIQSSANNTELVYYIYKIIRQDYRVHYNMKNWNISVSLITVWRYGGKVQYRWLQSSHVVFKVNPWLHESMNPVKRLYLNYRPCCVTLQITEQNEHLKAEDMQVSKWSQRGFFFCPGLDSEFRFGLHLNLNLCGLDSLWSLDLDLKLLKCFFPVVPNLYLDSWSYQIFVITSNCF